MARVVTLGQQMYKILYFMKSVNQVNIGTIKNKQRL